LDLKNSCYEELKGITSGADMKGYRENKTVSKKLTSQLINWIYHIDKKPIHGGGWLLNNTMSSDLAKWFIG
jgi:hypothetical protein